jgi:hypothetical protein
VHVAAGAGGTDVGGDCRIREQRFGAAEEAVAGCWAIRRTGGRRCSGVVASCLRYGQSRASTCSATTSAGRRDTGAQGRTRTLHGELADARRPRCGRVVERTIDGEVSRRIIKCLQVLITLAFLSRLIVCTPAPGLWAPSAAMCRCRHPR